MSQHSVTKIHRRFKGYNKDLRDIWESYCLVDYYMGTVHDLVKAGNIPPLPMQRLNGRSISLDQKNTFGGISHLTRKANPRRTLIAAVSLFEHYLGFLTKTVFQDFPGKLTNAGPTAEKEQENLLKLIVTCSDRAEIIERIVEEKVRGIFYGKPSDFFLKDKAKLEFGDIFKSQLASEVEKYEEVTARRNAIIHNDGCIDRKYLREVKNSTLTLGQVVPLEPTYLRESIKLLQTLSAKATEAVVVYVYRGAPQGVLSRVLAQI